MFALVDVNSFYASCERIFRPDIANKPVIVLSNNDGCVIARSKEVKLLGIKMGLYTLRFSHWSKSMTFRFLVVITLFMLTSATA